MIETITLGAGCFWCVEAVFMSLPGINTIEVGYCNGNAKEPTYEIVCSGNTGYAEVAQISFDSSVISFKEILDHFFQTHDPTTLNKQEADVGTQYRSGIFYHTNEQRDVAMEVIERWNKNNVYENPIITEVSALQDYYKAENYHQDYYQNNKSAPYCTYVIKPKLDKIHQ